MDNNKVKKRVRLSPEDRREQLLDATKNYIVKNGLNSLTMESVAIEANASKPLVYKYFDTRLELLQALLLREEGRRYNLTRIAMENAENYEQTVIAIVTHNFDERERGEVLQTLSAQPDIAAVLEGVKKRRDGGLGLMLGRAVMDEYGISAKDAQTILRMASAASINAAEQYSRSGGDRNKYINMAVTFINGGFDAISAKGP